MALRNAIPSLPEPRTLNPESSLLVGALIIIAALGCSSAPAAAQRGKIEGKVTLNGKPVTAGKIRLMAIDPSGTNVAADIKDGEFSVPPEQGPTKGKYRVEFSVPSPTKRRIPDDDNPGKFIEEAPETLPRRYNFDSTITADYDPANPHPLNFQLTAP
jgi:hypothetical protein